MNSDLEAFITGLAKWGEELCQQGRNAYLGTFQWEQLDPRNGPIFLQQKEDMQRVCSLLIQRSDSRPRSPARFEYLPFIIAIPDYPVVKCNKPILDEASPNKGMHWHTFSSHHPESRVPHLDEHFLDRQGFYKTRMPSLSVLHAKPITYTPGYLVDYMMKHVKRANFDIDDIAIYPSHSGDFARARIEKRAVHRVLQ